jgi:hypothetical protein
MVVEAKELADEIILANSDLDRCLQGKARCSTLRPNRDRPNMADHRSNWCGRSVLEIGKVGANIRE